MVVSSITMLNSDAGERRWKLLVPYALIFSTTVVLLFSKLLGVYFEPGLLGIDLR